MTITPSPSMPSSRPRLPRFALLAGVAAMLLALPACNTDKRIVSSDPAPDYRKIHPIVLVQGEATLDLFVNGPSGTIGERQVEDLQSFIKEHHQVGQGPIAIAVPTGSPGAKKAAAAIRSSLSRSGARSMMTAYTPAQPDAPAPIRLSFPKIEADVATKCGRWPSDLAGNGGTLEGFQNRSYENFGCASQGYLAAQVADPLDLVRPRPLGPGFGPRQADVVTRYGAGKSTQSESAEDTQTVSGAVQQ
ncbi:MAG: CpaD family pilus assembly protein [Labrys sp. (in: a-proteobacteria)]